MNAMRDVQQGFRNYLVAAGNGPARRVESHYMFPSRPSKVIRLELILK